MPVGLGLAMNFIDTDFWNERVYIHMVCTGPKISDNYDLIFSLCSKRNVFYWLIDGATFNY
jgi:hypothetical protein